MGRISSKKRKKTVLLRYSKRGDTVFFLSLPGFQHLFFFFADPQRLSDFLNCFVMCPVIETVFFQQFLCFFRKMNITDRYCPGDGHFYVIAIVMNLFHLLQHSIDIRFVDKKVQQTHNTKPDFIFPAAFQPFLQISIPILLVFIKWHVAQELSQIPQLLIIGTKRSSSAVCSSRVSFP